MQTTNTPTFIPTAIVPIVPTVPIVPAVPTVTVPNMPLGPTGFPVKALPTITPLGTVPVPLPTAKLTPKVQTGKLTPQVPQVPTGKLTPQVPQVPTVKLEEGTKPIALNVQTRIPNPTQIQVKELELRPWQIEWANRAREILLRNHGYIDTSRMRSGKTYVTLWLAKQYGFRLLIICPVIAIDVWRRTAAEYGVEVIDIISYQSLRSQRNHRPKHGYLDRHDNVTEGGVHQVHFYPTRAYLDLVQQGIMVICDEIQNIKNNSDQYKACNALIRPIISGGGLSRFGLLSGTPFDKEEHAVNILKLIGYIRAHRLYNYVRDTHELVLEGIQELIDACRFINEQETERVLSEIPLVKGKMNTLAYTLYTRVVKANISGAMAAPTDIRGTFNVGNGFYNMTGDRAQQLREAIDELANAVRFNERTGTAEIRADNIGAVTIALVHIENAKVEDWARVANKALMDNPTIKVIISVNYTSTIDEIRNLMLFFRPLVLNGQVPAKKRAEIVRLFNEDPTKRILIMNTTVGGVGISLYSPQPNSPRLMLMSPSYKLLDVTQAAARIYGPGMSSDAIVRMFYGRGAGTRETGILTALARKTQVLKGTLEEVVTRDLVLPGDYPAEEERDV